MFIRPDHFYSLDIMSPLASQRLASNSTYNLVLPSNDGQSNVINIVFGLFAVLASAVMIWQNCHVLRGWQHRCWGFVARSIHSSMCISRPTLLTFLTAGREYEVFELATYTPTPTESVATTSTTTPESIQPTSMSYTSDHLHNS